ncbi:hypothetical protein D3C85_1081590 [compost metagenome]
MTINVIAKYFFQITVYYYVYLITNARVLANAALKFSCNYFSDEFYFYPATIKVDAILIVQLRGLARAGDYAIQIVISK